MRANGMERPATGLDDGLAAAIQAKKELVVGYDALHGRDPYRTDPCTRDPRAAKIIFTFQDSAMPTRAVDKRPPMSIYMSSPLQGCAHVGRVMYVRPPLPLQEILESGCTLWHKDGSSLRLPVHESRAPLFLADYVVRSAVIESPSGSALSVFYDYMPPMFENICGAATCMHAVDTNDLLVKRSKTSFGACQEMFTVHGNITIRKVGTGPDARPPPGTAHARP